ncbi:chromatin modification-related protein EAF7-like [Helianthus annuus]|uniref:chromatin modification-related protein EAF7-like n=1 Tax=Helianthus annuus TaxID=4232 RepID=UPI000B8F8880|nr:chromatin modification-related protein EAF7-like [Helianthus annuus]
MEGFKEKRSKWFVKESAKPKKETKQTKRKQAPQTMLRDEDSEDDVISATSDKDTSEKNTVEINKDTSDEADDETTESEEARAEKRATRYKKKRSEDSDDETYMPSDSEQQVKKGSPMAKKSRKVVEEPLTETTTVGSELVVTEKRTPIVEEHVIPIRTPTASQ